jgi:hypothetical protein
MLVWLASYPRSGNTFLRIVLHRLYGARTSVIYDVDGVAERLGPEMVGFEERPGSLAAMRASAQVHFVKTHRRRDDDVDDRDKAICPFVTAASRSCPGHASDARGPVTIFVPNFSECSPWTRRAEPAPGAAPCSAG